MRSFLLFSAIVALFVFCWLGLCHDASAAQRRFSNGGTKIVVGRGASVQFGGGFNRGNPGFRGSHSGNFGAARFFGNGHCR